MKKILPFVAILVLGLLVYGNTLFNGFVYDDPLVVEGNPFITSFNNLKHLFDTDYYLGSGETSWRVIVTFSYFIDYQLWQFNPFGYHLTNLLLHLVNGMLFYILLIYLIPEIAPGELIKKNKSGINWTFLPFLSALIFVSHPLQAEAVNAIGFRHELLLTFFFFSSLILYFKHKKFSGFKKSVFFGFSLLCYLLAMLSKEPAVILPIIVILIEWFSCRNRNSRFINKKNIVTIFSFLAVLGLYLWVRFYWLVYPKETIGSLLGKGAFLGTTIYKWFLTTTYIFASYLKLFVFPVHLTSEYMISVVESMKEPPVLISVLLLIGIFIFIVRNFNRRSLWSFSLLWIFLPLIPVANIFPLHHPMAERYLYLSCAGFALFSGTLIIKILQTNKNIIIRRMIFSFIVLILLFYSVRAFTYNRVWKDKKTFWKNVVLNNPSPHRARSYSCLGLVYFRKGNYKKAKKYFRKSLRQGPYYAKAYSNLGLLYAYQENWKKGIKYFKKGLSTDSNLIKAYSNLGLAYVELGKIKEGIKNYKKVIDINPYLAKPYSNLGQAYFIKKDYDKAIEYFKKALKLNPHLAKVYSNLGKAYWVKEDNDKAINYYKKALELNPNLDKTYANLGKVYHFTGEEKKALKYFKKAVKLVPQNYKYNFKVGLVYLDEKEYQKAINWFRKVLNIVPDFAPAYYNIALSYYWLGKYQSAIKFSRKARNFGSAKGKKILETLKNKEKK